MFCSLPFIIQFLAVKSLIIFNILLSVMLKIWLHSLPSFRGQLRSNLVDKDVANFAQWRYTNQWSYREVVLLLVENWIPIPRLGDVKYRLLCQFLKVSTKPIIIRSYYSNHSNHKSFFKFIKVHPLKAYSKFNIFLLPLELGILVEL